jgi:4-diphosphocytidyl-2-C-methyl-D-erythritol kinase
MPVISEFAPAKVNLTLKVVGRRADGYHDIESLIAFARDVGDELFLEPDGPPGLEMRGPFAAAITGQNLVERALERLSAAEPGLALGRVILDKRLPVASGIGGGSTDAAALLRAVRRANPALVASLDWQAIAASLGADVTVCLAARPAFAWGTGTGIEPIPALPRLEAVLVNPLAQVPPDKTARVFAGLGAGPSHAAGKAPPMPPRFADADALIAYMRARGNDLLAPAMDVVPAIATVLDALAEVSGCRLTGLSGAGPTCFGIFAGREEAAAGAAHLRQSRPDWWVEASTLSG